MRNPHDFIRRRPETAVVNPFNSEITGLWFKIPPEIQFEAESKQLDFMGGLHAMEHAAIGVFPLLVMAGRNDPGGLSTTRCHRRQKKQSKT